MRFATGGRRWPGGLAVALILGGLASLLVATVPPFSAEAKGAPEAQVRVIAGHQVTLWRPPPSRLKEPVPVVVALHGVGANDNREADVPRRWDALLGKNRVERAQTFHRALTARGISSQLTIFPNADHALSPPMRDAALTFFQTLVDEENAWPRTAHQPSLPNRPANGWPAGRQLASAIG